MKLSVVIPVFNEVRTINKILQKVECVDLGDIKKEIVVVDDGSTDGTREILKGVDNCKVIFHEKNKGKGAAVRTGLENSTGDIVLVQDADLEYDPNEYPNLIKPIIEGKAKVVYGSRFMGKEPTEIFLHYIGNKLLTFATNVLYNSSITDMETCYKVMRREVLNDLNLTANRFEFEPEITSKILKKGYKIVEVPITYKVRRYNEGKKITVIDGVKAFYYLMKYKFGK